MRCARMRQHKLLHNCRTTGHCHGHTWRTLCHYGTRRHRCRCYPSVQPHAARSCMTRSWLWTCCIRRSTRRHLFPAGQTSACSGRSVSAQPAGRCPARSCPSNRWIRLCTRPTNDWRSRTRQRSAGSAAGCSWLHNIRCIAYSQSISQTIDQLWFTQRNVYSRQRNIEF